MPQQPDRVDGRHVAVTESPLLAWLDDVRWNWACEECGEFGPCPHFDPEGDSEVAALVDTITVLDGALGAHRSTARVAEALGDPVTSPLDYQCTVCAVPWPCPTVHAAEKAAEPVIARWLDRQPWYAPNWRLRLSSRQFREPRFPDGPPVVDGRVHCPHCHDDVTDGIEQWRAKVNAAYDYLNRLDARCQEHLVHVRGNAMDESWHRGYEDGLTMAVSHARTEFNILLGSHHRCLSFHVAERDAGHINPNMGI